MFVPLTPLRFMHRAVDLYGGKTAVISGDRQFTFAEFAARSERLATGLQARRIAPGDRVGYLSFNNHQLLEGYYGVLQAKAAIMPLNVRLSADELAAVVTHAEPGILFFEADFAMLVRHLRAKCPKSIRFACIDAQLEEADFLYEDVIAAGEPGRANIFDYDEQSVAELFYTSGSTGAPKGVTISHRSLYLYALSKVIAVGYDDSTISLNTIPLFHANGWGVPQTSMLMGFTQVMVRRFEPGLVLRMIEQYAATFMCVVPTMANALLASPELGARDLSSMRKVLIGGAAASPELIQRMEKAFPNARCVSAYGLTECSPGVALPREKSDDVPANEEARWDRQAWTGWVLPNVEARVADLHGKEVPKDGKSIGEILVRSDHVMEGYYKDPSATEAAITDGWLHTGDMAVWDEQGYLMIVDRKKEIIISGGENISSLEIERAIQAHPGVLECAVVAAPDDEWGEVPAAIIHLKPGSEVSAEELREFLKGQLSRYKVPRIFDFSDQPLPKSGTGKLKKLDMRERYWAGKAKRVQG
jgi:fatty-acyl-CoA synthase